MKNQSRITYLVTIIVTFMVAFMLGACVATNLATSSSPSSSAGSQASSVAQSSGASENWTDSDNSEASSSSPYSDDSKEPGGSSGWWDSSASSAYSDNDDSYSDYAVEVDKDDDSYAENHLNVDTYENPNLTVTQDGTYTDKDHVALYIHKYGTVPSNYISKTKARKAGWVNTKGNLWDVLPGMSIGGGGFYNDDGMMPDAPGREWFECDIDYEGGYRNAKRIVYSNDGLIYYTDDHYKTFERLY